MSIDKEDIIMGCALVVALAVAAVAIGCVGVKGAVSDTNDTADMDAAVAGLERYGGKVYCGTESVNVNVIDTVSTEGGMIVVKYSGGTTCYIPMDKVTRISVNP